MPVKGGYLLISGIGGVFLWSGIRGKSTTDVIRKLIGGQSPNTAQSANSITTDFGGATGVTNSPVPQNLGAGGSYPSGGGNAAQNQALAKLMLAGSHPTWAVGSEWQALVNLWNEESGWNNLAQNTQSGAFGIPQALPYTKMPKAAWPVSAGGTASAAAQIAWGLAYIASQYGSPSAAYAFENSHSPAWY